MSFLFNNLSSGSCWSVVSSSLFLLCRFQRGQTPWACETAAVDSHWTQSCTPVEAIGSRVVVDTRVRCAAFHRQHWTSPENWSLASSGTHALGAGTSPGSARPIQSEEPISHWEIHGWSRPCPRAHGRLFSWRHPCRSRRYAAGCDGWDRLWSRCRCGPWSAGFYWPSSSNRRIFPSRICRDSSPFRLICLGFLRN